MVTNRPLETHMTYEQLWYTLLGPKTVLYIPNPKGRSDTPYLKGLSVFFSFGKMKDLPTSTGGTQRMKGWCAMGLYY